MLGQLRRAHFIGHIRQRVPPPPGLLECDPLRVKHPHGSVLGTHVASRVDDVALVRRHKNRARRVEDSGDDQRRALAGARTGNHHQHVLPRAVELLRSRDRDSHHQTDAAGHSQAQCFRLGVTLTQSVDVAAAPHVPGGPVDTGAVLLTPVPLPEVERDQDQCGGRERRGEPGGGWEPLNLPSEQPNYPSERIARKGGAGPRLFVRDRDGDPRTYRTLNALYEANPMGSTSSLTIAPTIG